VFKRSATKIVAGLQEKGYGEDKVSVTINGTAPRRGNFIVTLAVGKSGKSNTIVELLALKRPFTALRELDIDSVVTDITKLF